MQVPGDACGSVIAGVGSSLGVIGSIHRHVTVTERACVTVTSAISSSCAGSSVMPKACRPNRHRIAMYMAVPSVPSPMMPAEWE